MDKILYMANMTFLPVFAILVAATLVLLFVHGFAKASPERRKLYFVPGIFQLFAVSIALVRGGVFPEFLPAEIITIFSYFFSLYLTYSTAVSFATSDKKKSAIWSLAAVSFWILAIWG